MFSSFLLGELERWDLEETHREDFPLKRYVCAVWRNQGGKEGTREDRGFWGGTGEDLAHVLGSFEEEADGNMSTSPPPKADVEAGPSGCHTG